MPSTMKRPRAEVRGRRASMLDVPMGDWWWDGVESDRAIENLVEKSRDMTLSRLPG